jgi:O-antigen/teichoic acid export membrane protein
MLLTGLLNSSLFKATSAYGLIGISKKLIPFLLLPILTAYLSPEDYGLLALYTILLTVFITLSSAGVIGAVGREFFDKNKQTFSVYVTNCLLIIAIATGICSAALYLFQDFVYQMFYIPSEFIWTIIATALATNILQLNVTIFQSEQRPVPYGIWIISFAVIEIMFSLYLIIAKGLSWEGRVFGQVIAAALFFPAILILLKIRGLLSFKINKADTKAALSFGIPLLPHMLAGLIITITDRLLLSHMMDKEAVGIYAVGAQIGLVVSMVAYAFNQAWAPWFFAKLTEGNNEFKKQIVKITYIYTFSIISFAIMFGLNSFFLYKLLIDPAYATAYGVSIIIALSGGMTGLYYMAGSYITFKKKTHIHSYITVIIALVNIALSYLFILKYGIYGAALGTLLTNFVAFVLTAFYANKLYPMPWALKS